MTRTLKKAQIKQENNLNEPDLQNFVEAVKLSAQYLGFEALSRGCYNIFHACKLLENITESDQSYVPYSSDE